ncbi:unnamed protein product [Lathyrus sativus]|nr:unnamed protein product [Lathyrus sativus]
MICVVIIAGITILLAFKITERRWRPPAVQNTIGAKGGFRPYKVFFYLFKIWKGKLEVGDFDACRFFWRARHACR